MNGCITQFIHKNVRSLSKSAVFHPRHSQLQNEQG